MNIAESLLQDGVTYILNCSYYELYNEHITDLLQPSTEESLQVRVHPRNGPFIERLSAEQVTTGDHPPLPCHLFLYSALA